MVNDSLGGAFRIIQEGFGGGGYIRRYEIQVEGGASENHCHPYDHHTTFCGPFEVYEGDSAESMDRPYRVKCGDVAFIPAGQFHYFVALAPRAVYVCTHQLHKEDGTILTDAEARHMSEAELRALTSLLTEQRPRKVA